MPRALLIANPHSRRGADVVDTARKALSSGGLDLVVPAWKEGVAIADMIEREGRDVDLVVVAGGDGTLNAAARGVMALDKPLGILPAGTANDLARTLELPLDPAAAAAIILSGKRKRIDIGDVNGHPFFNVASIGMSASLADRLTADGKRRWGRLSYLAAALGVLLRARPFHATISGSHGRIEVKTLQIAIGNGRHYGGGMIVEETAEIDDGTLDLYSLEFEHPWRLPLIARAFKAGRHGVWDDVRTLRGTRFEIRTRRPRSINTDGELVARTPAVFRVLPRAIEVFVP